MENIVVGIDFSACASAAARHAVHRARTDGARLHVLHAIETLNLADLARITDTAEKDLRDTLLEHARNKLKDFCRAAEVPGSADVEAVLGAPLDRLIQKVKESAAELLVLGVHGRQGSRNTGSVAVNCVRSAPVNVLLVREKHAGGFRKVAACVDFSEHSRRALEEAVRTAVTDGSELHVLHVFSGPWSRLDLSVLREISRSTREREKEEARERLAEFVRPFTTQLADREVKLSLVEAQHHGPGILDYTRQNDVDLLVMSTVGRSGSRYLLLGSTIERVIHLLPCSLLAVRAAPALPG